MSQVRKYSKNICYADYRLFKNTSQCSNIEGIDIVDGISIIGGKDTKYQQKELALFCQTSNIPLTGKYPVKLEISSKIDGRCIDVTKDETKISASCDDELWRAVFEWCNLLRSTFSTVLPLGKKEGKLWLKYRLARCPWGPTHRAPDWKDELVDSVDYYPDEFLRQLAWDGVNGIWITGTFRELAVTGFEPVDPKRLQRIAKLRKTVKKCAKFGIKVWLFCIEPFNFTEGDSLMEAFPELQGAPYFHRYAFCPTGVDGQTFIRNSVRSIFTDVPNLGGILNISHGERGTTCLSSISCIGDDIVQCPRCANLPKAQIVGNALNAMRQGMDEAGAFDAGLISWLYMPHSSSYRAPWVYEIPNYMPERTVLQYNFESGGNLVQLGKVRNAGDYHLSYVGPADSFKNLAKNAKKAGIPMSAKLQVSSSIEVETLDYVPVPGILYDKYKAMKKYGVSSVMQSWIFGSKLGLMTRAAGLLASEDFSGSRKDFLYKLAIPEWGDKADQVVKAWEYFSKAYLHFPFCNIFQYYGPLNDGASWKLYPKLAYIPLTPGWKVDFPLSGDAIGEALKNHTIEEAIVLMEKCNSLWQKGMKCLQQVSNNLTPAQEQQLVNIRAMAIQVGISVDILRFYKLRSMKTFEAICKMEKIVRNEIRLRKELLLCIKKNPSLGFHSEACAFKYDANSISKAIKHLENLLIKEFPMLKNNPEKILLPLPEYDCSTSKWENAKTFRWCMKKEAKGYRFYLENLASSPNPSFTIAFMDRMLIRPMRSTRIDRTGIYADDIKVQEFAFDKQGGFSLLIPFDSPLFSSTYELGFSVFRVEDAIDDNQSCESSPAKIYPNYVPRLRLYLGYFNPGAMFLLKNYI